MTVRKSGRPARCASRAGGNFGLRARQRRRTALEALSDCLRLEAKPFGIDVVVIEPGGIATERGAIALRRILPDRAFDAVTSRAVGTPR
ncbi:hypothetical protein ACFRAI_21230 [Streptomyces sp. NPDC056637]|uniref:hypothetical protein n=1 Tax=unclassified Streptomyces TaxID=2593676 RepID=UPI003661B639